MSLPVNAGDKRGSGLLIGGTNQNLSSIAGLFVINKVRLGGGGFVFAVSFSARFDGSMNII